MILTAAVNAYLERELDAHSWVKGLSEAQLDAALSRLDPKPDLHPHLRLHQKACFLLGVSFPAFGFFLDMGSGKTLLSLELLKYWFKVGVVRRAIIFVTSDKAFDTWEKQIEGFKIGLPYVSLQGSSKEKWEQLEALQEGLVIVPYPGAVAMVSKRVKAKKKGMKFQLDKKLVKRLSYWADGLVLDESTRCGSPGSLTFKLVAQLRKYSFSRYLLAGRPFGRNPTMLWPQYYILDGGETLGETLGLFRAAFFSEQPNRWDPKGYAKDYTFKKSMRPKLSEMVQHRSITYSADECIDLPAVIPIREVVHLPEEAGAYYARAMEDIKEAKGDVREMKNAFLRMRQISSGFIGYKNDATGERAEIELLENPKLERLLEIIEDLPEGAKAVVFHAYTFSGRKISEALKERGIGSIWLWSGTKNSKEELNRFFKDPKVEVAVLNNQVGAYSLDGLQDVANYSLFYESPIGVIDREQAERRLVRQGQKRKVFQFDIVCRGTVDERVLDFHQEGRDFFDEVLRKPGLLR